MKLYCGTYHKYNCGSLAGAWLDLDDYSSKEEFLEACLELHNDEEDPELMFQDYEAENSLEERFYSESYISEDYWEYKEAIEDCGIDAETVAEYISYQGFDNVLEGIRSAENHYIATYSSGDDYVEEVIEMNLSGVELPSIIRCHLDYEGILRDLSFEEIHIHLEGGSLAVFSY